VPGTAGKPAPEFENFGLYLKYIGSFAAELWPKMLSTFWLLDLELDLSFFKVKM